MGDNLAKEKILLVEDDAIESMDIKRTLESFGYEVPYIASRGDEAVEKAVDITPDLILMDIILKGGINGIEAASKIKNLDIPLIFLTAHSEDATVQKAKLTEPYGYIIKPFDSSELRYAIELALYKNKMEKELKLREKLLNSIINNSPILQFVIDEHHRILYWNQSLADYSGIPSEEIIGTDEHWRAFYNEKRPCLADLMVDGDVLAVNKWYSGKYRESEHLKGAYDAEDFFPSMGENGKWLHFTAATIKDENANIIGALETLEDITERKKAEKDLMESEEKFREVFNNANDAFYLLKITETGVNENFAEVNDVASQMLGYTEEELLEMSPNTIDASDQSLMADNWRKIVQNGKAIFETVHKTKNGKIIPVEINARIFEIKGEKTLLAIVRDINERKLVEKALKNSEAEYKAIFDNIKNGVAVYNAVDDGNDFIFKDFNHAAEKIEQVKKEDIIGRKVTEVFSGVQEFGLLEVFQRVWKTGKSEKHPISIYEDERIKGWRENYVYKLPSGDIVAVYDDLTDIKQYEEELEQNETRLRSLVRILQYQAESVQDFLDYALNEATKLTESKIGYIYYYYEDRREFVLNTWSKGVMSECTVTEPETVYELSKTGIWGEAVRQRKPIILNDFQASHPLKKGFPKGHAPLYKFMTIPVFSGDEIVAVIGVANKKTNYTETDVLQLELLMDSVWKVVDRQQTEEALKKSEARYRIIFENTGTATAISENNMILSLVNEEFAQLTGYSKNEIESKMSWTDFFLEEELPRMMEYHRLRRINPEKAPRNYESRLQDRDGTVKDVYMSVVLIPDTDKSLISVLDITEKKQSRIKLRRELKINQALAKIYAPLISPFSSIQDISFPIKGESMALTGSEHGYVATIDPKNKDLVNQTLTKMMPAKCQIYEKDIPEEVRFPIGPDGLYSGLWGHSLNTKEPFYTNKPDEHPTSKGVPEGHIKMDRFLSVPVMLGEDLVGQIALANPGRDYSDDDLNAVERIAEFYALAIQRKMAEEQISKSLDEKNVLLREVHHRVKNNLQIISSILNLQSFIVKDKVLLDILKQNQNRIKSMAMIHEKLYHSPDLVQIDFSDYIKSLSANIFYSYAVKKDQVNLVLDIDENIMLNIETSIPCGLIYSELLSNSIKHAFPNGMNGEIEVLFKKDDGDLMLRVIDNGVGLPKDVDFHDTDSLGLKLVDNLVKQIEGTIEIDQSHGTAVTVKFQELKYKDRI